MKSRQPQKSGRDSIGKAVSLWTAAAFLILCCGSAFAIGPADLTDLNTATALQLATTLLPAGATINPLSVVFTGVPTAAGAFQNGLPDGINLDHGILLTTGAIVNAVGPNLLAGISAENAQLGDPGLTAILAPQSTFDASALEFDFALLDPAQNFLTFRFVFGSDEYNEVTTPGSIFGNDIFAIFLDGVNIAFIPGIGTPISVSDLSLASNPFFFHNNDPDVFGLPTPFATQYDGFSKVIAINVPVVNPAIPHHLKIVIADTADEFVDSTVFFAPVTVGGANGDISNEVTRYYNDVLGRAPDAGGLAFWTSGIAGIIPLGIDIKEGFQGLAKNFFDSAEYVNQGNADNAFVTDLYQTFLGRAPDPGGLTFWMDQLVQGLTRDMLITAFGNSFEFVQFLERDFGAANTRPEHNLINDFYRGILNRFPDTGGFNLWHGLVRTAQCTGAQAVRDVSSQISSQFINSAEYALRNRDNSGFVEDLYNAFLRRGADPAGFTGWVTALNTQTRDQVLQAFVNSPEFQFRVTEVINAGCLP